MKKLLAPILLTISTCFVLNQKSVTPVHANELFVQKNAVVVPKDIDLNDVKEENIRAYYTNLNSLSNEERQGTNLLKNLKPILKNGHTPYFYKDSASTQVWQAYEIIDRDWSKSPAKDIEGYDPATNTITGYKYGKGTSDIGSDPYIHALYVNRDKENGTKAWSDHSQNNYGINQEHIWPKSAGFEDKNSDVGARGDLHHLWAGNGYVNGQIHNNWYFGNVDKNQTFTDAGSKYNYLSGNLKGVSKTFGGSVDVFEPQNSDKGDIARAIFYMMARYNYLTDTGEEVTSAEPNLEIVNDITSWQNEGYQSTKTETGKIGILHDLLEWNKLDPVDYFEIHRNNLVYNNYGHNRNPFIDFPQWADYIWGTAGSGSSITAPTSYANPNTDKIAEGNETPVYPSDDSKKLDIKMIAIIGGVALVVLVVLIIIFSKLSKKNKRKVLKTTTKYVKKATKSSKKKR